jgi:hypothetical protein
MGLRRPTKGDEEHAIVVFPGEQQANPGVFFNGAVSAPARRPEIEALRSMPSTSQGSLARARSLVEDSVDHQPGVDVHTYGSGETGGKPRPTTGVLRREKTGWCGRRRNRRRTG